MTQPPEQRPDLLAGADELPDEPNPDDVDEFDPDPIDAERWREVTEGELDPDDDYVEGVDRR
ncbi:hypothetical protein [Allonocardiopsis opalescens]|uniref:Uncharacterized protein n=1 Tax=Allonocardiopsis opalescens TaxID=1144618 RepID=A0A2T0PTB1_9ACTN|nr:hypothetical protein [Allonocardiopsis opalescens]PRX91956.1 hypothetical protein CLV72_11229 [Allonocardiopsis opalescens]